jgi:hypothetical protein
MTGKHTNGWKRFLVVSVLVGTFLIPPHSARAEFDWNSILEELAVTVYEQLLLLQAEDDIPIDGEGEALPLGQAAIDYVRTNNPGKQVKAASLGTPIFTGTIYPPPQPQDDPDFCDRVEEIIIDALILAFQEIAGIPATQPAG